MIEIPQIPATPYGYYDPKADGSYEFFNEAGNVARGAGWLDEHFPGWERRVDVGLLDISRPNACICGQVVPQEMIEAANQQTGYGAVVNGQSDSSAYGFAGSRHGDYWVLLIKERFDTGTLSDAV